jgi:Protein of unknown function (DUF3347)
MTLKTLALGISCAVFALVATSAQQRSTSTSADATKAIVTSYLEIQAQLAADHFENVKGPARALTAQAVALGKQGADLAKAATAFEAAADLKGAREAFGALSDAVIAHVKASPSKDVGSDLRLAYCSMVKKSWLQRDAQVRNPYYGTTMSNCGEFKPLR